MSNFFQNPSTRAVVLVVAAAAGLQASEQDARIVAAAKNSYVFKTHLRGEKIGIVSQQGVVTLTGKVSTDNHRTLAEDTVAGLPGVKEVRNELQVAGEPGLDTPDGKLRAKVQSALFFHRHVSATRTKVAAKDGVITLRGEADSQAQKALTADYVKEIAGVTQVVNEMTVAKHPRKAELKRKIDDASITAQLKAALLMNGATSALNTKVVTTGGTVTLTGKAKTRAERELCSRIANDIDGVRAVRNQMTIED